MPPTLSPLDFLLPEICVLKFTAGCDISYTVRWQGSKAEIGTQLLAYQVYAPFLVNYDRVIVFSEVQRDLLARLTCYY